MRTTVELPEDLMRAAKAHAASRGESRKTFMTRAVAHELGTGSGRPSIASARVTFPLIHGTPGVDVHLTNEDIADLETGRRS